MSSVREQPSAPKLDPIEEKLLNELAVQSWSGHPSTVGAALRLTKLATPSTLQRKISSLKSMGLIETQRDPSNPHAKLLVSSDLAVQYLEDLGSAMLRR